MTKQEQHIKLRGAAATLAGYTSTCWLKNTANWLSRLNYHVRQVEAALEVNHKATKNRLEDTRCYLAGAMEKDKSNGVEWRQTIQTSLVSLGIHWFDPTDKPTETGRENIGTKQELFDTREAGDYDTAHDRMKVIRCVDLRMVDISDFLIVNLDPDIPTFGTHEEISNANRQKKPVIIRIVGGKKKTPLWLLGMLPHQLIFSTWEEIHNYLRHIAHDPIIDRLNRWYFFDSRVK